MIKIPTGIPLQNVPQDSISMMLGIFRETSKLRIIDNLNY